MIHPRSNAPLALLVDASNVGVGAVLQQRVDGNWHLLSFFSKRLQPAEVRYSTFGRELLAAYLAVKHFNKKLLIQEMGGRQLCQKTFMPDNVEGFDNVNEQQHCFC